MKLNPHNTSPRHTRHGFSLIELLVVIVIIGILMALILPAINGARIRARITGVATEITQLDQAIATFKNQFQVEPPSSLNIPPAGTNWSPADAAIVRTIWPQFDFANRGGLGAAVPDLHLSGAECLVFFLGGLQTGSAGSGTVIGFSKNPITPWISAGSNRVGPFFEFDSGRFTDVDGDSLFEYRDNLPDQETPYFLLSSQGKLYDKTNSPNPPPATEQFDDFDVFPDPPNTLFSTTGRNMSFPYLKADGNTPQRSGSYQIISPGLDGIYGAGGIYTNGDELKNSDFDSDGVYNSIIDNGVSGVLDPLDSIEARRVEADNITNFSGGTLLP